ncbi:PKD domain-containing protein [Flavobacterium sp. SORGH_AS_0622]|jgi:chitodextrinase|uniref:PKD domain-containing protein n=1 Tax=Flavobacterium sp. SORGH_AS_0622 TaxID=3041772 RepID=UPI00277D464A|nr:PKD domain-containing protein [Flavobacterium sp. SORGH_AS_0622]MDQ1167849.1 chitodextrinase [Flavobacterium sp. SORGH_AS_0622]
MRKITTILVLVTVLFISNSCSKHDDEVIIDCLAESIYIKIHNSTDTSNPKLMNYSVEYTGTGTLSSVKWSFGDGTVATGAAVTHTYAAAGEYTATAAVTIKKDGSECTSSPKRTVTIN